MKKKSTACEIVFFAAFHIILVVLCAMSYVKNPVLINSSFLDAVPDSHVEKGFSEAQKAITNSGNSTVTLYISSNKYEDALSCARAAVKRLADSSLFDKIPSDGFDSFSIDEMSEFLCKNAAYLLPESSMEAIEKSPQQYADEHLALAFSPFTIVSANSDEDPFLLGEDVIMSYIEKASSLTRFTKKDGFLVSKIDGLFWIMIPGEVSKDNLSVAGGGRAKKIFEVADSLEADYSSCQVYTSGFPLHADESSTSAKHEIAFITILSVSAMLVMFVFVCRNFYIIRLFAYGIALSFICGVSAVFMIFRNVHVMTFIFGTTLIGTCIDYSIHFYMGFARKNTGDSSYDVRKRIFKSLTVGFASTEICYLAMLFSGYALLRQISVFCAFGLLSSYLSALFLYPAVIRESMINPLSPAATYKEPHLPGILLFITAGMTVLLITQIGKLEVRNNISNLYTPAERLMKSEEIAGRVSGYSSALYAAVSGQTEQEALENAEKYSTMLRMADCSFVSADMFIPSVETQKKSIASASCLLPYIENQCEILGVPKENEEAVRERISGNSNFVYEADLPQGIRNMLSNLYIGEIDGKWYQGFVIRDCPDREELKRITDSTGNAVLFNTAEDISSSLDSLTRLILIAFGVSLFIMAVSLPMLYGFKKGIRMFLSPYCVIASTLSVAPFLNMKVDFFYASGMILVLGLGLDYIVFASDEKGGSFMGLTLSFITTQLSFGTLLFSSFRPVKIFATAVFFGILTAYICAVFSHRRNR